EKGENSSVALSQVYTQHSWGKRKRKSRKGGTMGKKSGTFDSEHCPPLVVRRRIDDLNTLDFVVFKFLFMIRRER
ncbi:hypothetical protein DRJ25_04770, partial [Candidatus Woesearchaeota archaeon]